MVCLDELFHHISYGDRGSLQEDIGERNTDEYHKLLLFAVEYDQLECLKVIAQYCDPETTNALQKAVRYNSSSCVEFLLPSRNIEDAWRLAVHYGRLGCVNILLPHCQQHYNIGLHQALDSEQWSIASLLMDYAQGEVVLEQLHGDTQGPAIQWLDEAISQRQHEMLHACVEHTGVNKQRKI